MFREYNSVDMDMYCYMYG